MSRSSIIFAVASCVVAIHFALSYATLTNSYIDTAAYIQGRERLPFQYRALSAWIVSTLIQTQPVLAALAGRLPAPFNDQTSLAFLLLNAVSILIVIGVTRHSLQLITSDFTFAAFAAFVPAYMAYFNYVLAYGLRNYSYAYDIPQLALFSVAVTFLLANKYWHYLAAFVLATLNRETSAFLILMWIALANLRAPERTRTIFRILQQVGLFLAIRAGLFALYRDNPYEAHAAAGGFFVSQLRVNIESLLTYRYWPNYLSNFGFMWIVLIIGWRDLRPARLRRLLLVIPPWILGMLCVGKVTEIRVFGELISVVSVLVSATTFNHLHRQGFSSNSPTASSSDSAHSPEMDPRT